jgi:hypothetical protein
VRPEAAGGIPRAEDVANKASVVQSGKPLDDFCEDTSFETGQCQRTGELWLKSPLCKSTFMSCHSFLGKEDACHLRLASYEQDGGMLIFKLPLEPPEAPMRTPPLPKPSQDAV